MKRCRFLVNGQVQAVGFRPLVYRLAQELALTGWIKNTALGVLIEVQGKKLDDFPAELKRQLPPLAKIDSIDHLDCPLVDEEQSFLILESEPGPSQTLIAADTAVCSDCLQELFDPGSAYHRYPFINCTGCGPRFTITRALPYDRCQTAMDVFPLCSFCEKDYSDPGNRRYHAQPTACGQCGPQLSCSLESIRHALEQGQILAIKGIGGYQLLCDAKNEKAVLTLRQRKQRRSKPLALMLLNDESCSEYVTIKDEEKNLLNDPARPIVLLDKKENQLPKSIAMGLSTYGIMLPSSPLHYLIFHALAGYPQGHAWLEEPSSHVLVVTSANVSGKPLLTDDQKARDELNGIADVMVSFNREIVTRADDSVLRLINKRPALIRRARGFCPKAIELPHAIPPTLALGAALKNTFCITRGKQAFVSQYLGSLNNKESIDFFHESLDHWLRFLDVKPEALACDLHPDFYSSQFAQRLDLPITKVQHHHAHLAAVAAEYQLTEPALGLALDGYGFGCDQKAWGGELMYLEEQHFERLGSFSPLPLAGGDLAAREPWRMAAAVLHLLGENNKISKLFNKQAQAKSLSQLLDSGFPFQESSSCGRWFDAASALLGLCTVSDYEGQAAMLLESQVTALETCKDGWYFDEKQFNPLPVFKTLLNTHPNKGANLFHGCLVEGLSQWLFMWAEKTKCQTVLLSGGCFLNKVLSEGLINKLHQKGLNAYLPQQLPPNDSGLSLGQAWIAGYQLTFKD